MGANIHIVTDNYKDIYSKEFYQNEEEYRSKMKLSGDFAELLSRLNVSFGESELKQVETITKVDLLPLWKMATYHDEKVDVPEGNISTVLNTVVNLIQKLNDVENLEVKIQPCDDDLDFNYYFSDFLIDKANDERDNNFGQDLRNLARLLEYALSKSTTKVWFNIE